MIMADVLKILFLILGAIAVFLSYWLAAAALFPEAVERARRQYDGHPFRVTLLGVAVLLPFGGIATALAAAPNPMIKLIGAMLAALLVLLGLFGSAGLSLQIGCGMPAEGDESQPWRRVLRGGLVLAFTFLMPFLGWFLVMPGALVSGVGAAVSALASRPPREPVVLPPAQVVGTTA